jgi:serine/threonine protein kinase
MPTEHNGSADRERRLDEAVASYLQAAEAGRAPDRRACLARYPDLAADLARFFAGQDEVERAAGPLRAAAAVAPSPAAKPRGDYIAQVAGDPAGVPGDLGQLGDFRLLREAGRGGMGVVYEAVQLSLGRRVALKVLPFAATMDPRQLQRFYNEARAAASLDHPHIVHVHAVGSERGVHYYAMQFIDGQTVEALIRQLRGAGGEGSGVIAGAGPLADSTTDEPNGAPGPAAGGPSGPPPDTIPEARAGASTRPQLRDRGHCRRVAELGTQAAEALEYAHGLGVVHRDVKPANLMLDAHGELWVTDFGLARTAADSGLTLTGDLLGTLRYMSPEQALAKHGLVDHRTDVYALGATLYELLTLRPAVDGLDREEILRRVAFEEPASPRALDRSIPADLETVVLKALAKEPKERYATARELADDLRRFLESRPILARRPALAQRALKWAGRHRAVVGAAALLLAVVTAGSLLSTWLVWQERGQTLTEARAKDEALAQKGRALSEKQEALARADANFLKALDGVGQTVEGLGPYRTDFPPEVAAVRAEVLKRAKDYFVAFLQENEQDPTLRLETLLAHSRLADVLQKQNDLLAAYHSLDAALRLGRDLAEHYPGHARYTQEMDSLRGRIHLLSRRLHGAAQSEERAGRFGAAEQRARAAFDLVDRWGNLDASADDLLKALFLLDLANTLHATHRLPEAEAALRRSAALADRQAAANPDIAPSCVDLRFRSHRRLSRVLMEAGETKEAEALLRENLHLLADLHNDAQGLPFGPVHGPEMYRAWLHAELADVLRILGRPDEAGEAARLALPGLAADSLQRFWLLATVPDAKLRDPKAAIRLSQSWLEKMAKPQAVPPVQRAAVLTTLGVAQLAAGDAAAAVEALKEAHYIYPGGQRGALFYLAMAHARGGSEDEARRWYDRAVQHMDQHRPHDPEQQRLRAEAAELLGVKGPPPAQDKPAAEP